MRDYEEKNESESASEGQSDAEECKASMIQYFDISEDSENESDNDEEHMAPITTTRSGRVVKPNTWYTTARDNIAGVNLDIRGNDRDSYESGETALVGVSLNMGAFQNMAELHVLKYNEAMKINPIRWQKAVDEEYERMVKAKAFKVLNWRKYQKMHK